MNSWISPIVKHVFVSWIFTAICRKHYSLAAAIAPWLCLRLPSCGPGFESQAHHLCFFMLKLKLYCCWNKKRTKINEKEAGIGPYFKKTTTAYHLGQWYNSPYLLLLKSSMSNCIMTISQIHCNILFKLMKLIYIPFVSKMALDCRAI